MDRRTIIATAGAVTVTVLAGTTAIAANVGILDRGKSGNVGELSPVADMYDPQAAPVGATTATVTDATSATLPPEVQTIIVDETVPAPAGGAVVAGSPGSEASPVTDDTTVDMTPDSTPGVTSPGTPPVTDATPYDDDGGEDDDSYDGHEEGDDEGDEHPATTVPTTPGDDDDSEDHDEEEDDDEEEHEGGEDDD